MFNIYKFKTIFHVIIDVFLGNIHVAIQKITFKMNNKIIIISEKYINNNSLIHEF